MRVTHDHDPYIYTTKQVAALAGVPVSTIYARIAAKGDHDHIFVGNTKLYPKSVLESHVGRNRTQRPDGFPLKTHEVAKRLGITYEAFCQRVLYRGDHAHVRVGRTKYYPLSVLHGHLAEDRYKEENPFN